MFRKTFRTYRLQVVVFFSFLALFSLIVAGIVFYGYRSNSEIMLKSSDELLYQISETVIRQTINHLEPARKTGYLLRRMIERGATFSSSPDLVETISLETLDIYPQFSAVYLGDENGNFIMARRLENGNFSTKIVSRTADPVGVIEVERTHDGLIVATSTSSILNYDPRERPWYVLAKSEGKVVWSREYRLFTDQVPGITSAHPVYDADGNFVGAVGIDFRLGELSEFLKSLKIGDSGIAFILDSEGNILAYPEKASVLDHGKLAPRSPTLENMKTGWVKEALDTFLETRERKFNIVYRGEKYIASFRPFPEKYGRNWDLGIIVPEDDFIGPIARTHETTLLFSFWLLIIGGFLTSALARELTEPIKSLTYEADRIKSLDFEGEINIRSPITEIQRMGETMNSMKKALNAFKKYVPSEIVQSLVSTHDEAKLDAHSQEITIMFTDIYDFSSITENVPPAELMDQLSVYFDEIGLIIHRHGGTIDKYIGDSVMAFWGAPTEDELQASHACSAALEIIKVVDKLNQKWQEQGRAILKTRIGINKGISLVGNFGSSDRFNYTAIGDCVNLASRLEALNKIYLSRIIVSESVFKGAGEEFIFRPLDLVAVKGKENSVKIFQLLGLTTEEDADKNKRIALKTDQALKKYLERDWPGAYEEFQSLLEEFGDDFIAEMYMNRCRELGDNPPGKDWDGVFRVHFK
ncbi:MAG: adenylate/guanylate cyclase domain-containing protein [Candidatus Rifleibacteriota bacterium]